MNISSEKAGLIIPLIALAPAIFFTTIIAGYRGYLQGWQQMTPTALSQIVETLSASSSCWALRPSSWPYGLDHAAGGASLGAAPVGSPPGWSSSITIIN